MLHAALQAMKSYLIVNFTLHVIMHPQTQAHLRAHAHHG